LSACLAQGQGAVDRNDGVPRYSIGHWRSYLLVDILDETTH